MKIPVYRSQAAATNEAPGRSIRARMNAQPFIEAALRKGEVVSTVLSEVGSYAKMRTEAAINVQLNEALLAGEEQMRQTAYALENSSDVYSVFDTGTKWADTVNDVRTRLRDGIGSRTAEAKFDAMFGQQELNFRFALRDAVDTKIKAREQKALEARTTSIENTLSDPNQQISSYSGFLGAIESTQQSMVDGKRANPELVKFSNLKLKTTIASRTAAAYVGDNPSRAIALATTIEFMDDVARGEMTMEELMAKSNLGPDAAYTLYTLQNIPADVAYDRLVDIVKSSNTLFDAKKKQEKADDDQTKKNSDNAYNAYFYFDGSQPNYSYNDLPLGIKSVFNSIGIEFETISNSMGKELITNYLDQYNLITPSQREEMDKTSGSGDTPYAVKTNNRVYDVLFNLKELGTLTIHNLNTNKADLSREDYVALRNSLQTEANEAVNTAKDIAAAKFGYDALMAGDGDRAKTSRAAYQIFVASIEAEVESKRLSGEPLNPSQINAFAKTEIAAQMEFFVDALRVEMQGVIARINRDQAGNGLNLSVEDPIGDLDAWFNNLSGQKQREMNNRYSQTKALFEIDYKKVLNP